MQCKIVKITLQTEFMKRGKGCVLHWRAHAATGYSNPCSKSDNVELKISENLKSNGEIIIKNSWKSNHVKVQFRARAQAEPPQNKMQKKQESESKLNKVNVLKAQGSLVRICNAMHHLYQSEGSVV